MDELDSILTMAKEVQEAENKLVEAQIHARWNMAAMITCIIANCHRDPKSRPYDIQDFMPDFDEVAKPKKQQTWQEQKAIVEALNAVFGGVDLRSEGG